MKYTKVVNEDSEEIIGYVTPEVLLNAFKDKTVLVTGASGMIGSYFIYTLLKLNELYSANVNIKAFVRNPGKLDEFISNNDHVEVLVGDITTLGPLEVDGPVDYVIHAASPASPKIMSKEPVMTNLANTLGTIKTLDLANSKGASGYLFISSREIYGQPNEGQEEFTEDGPLGQVNPLVPRNGYAEGKKAAENLCSGYHDEFGLNTKIVRLAHTYGPGMSITDGRVQADFLNDIIHDRDIVLKSDGSSVRTYTYIADAIKAMFLVLATDSKELVYNIADEASKTSIRELAETMVSIEPEKGLKLVFDIPEQDINLTKGSASFTHGILSTKRIRDELGWTPKYSIKEGFTRTVEHLREELSEKKTDDKVRRISE